jgi:hypothetical protein
MATSTIKDRQTLETASDGRAPEEEKRRPEGRLYLRLLFVRVLARRVIVPGVRVDIVGRAGIHVALHARGGTGGLARILFVAAKQLVQPTHEGSSSFVWIRRSVRVL